MFLGMLHFIFFLIPLDRCSQIKICKSGRFTIHNVSLRFKKKNCQDLFSYGFIRFFILYPYKKKKNWYKKISFDYRIK